MARVSLTQTFNLLVSALLKALGRSIIMVLPVLALVVVQPANAQETEEPSTGFFQIFPAVPKIELPSISIPFWTDDLKKARKAYNSGNYSKALKYFRRSSDDGNSIADWYLASMYRMGQGLPADQAVAYSYYSRVAENYDPQETDPQRLRVMVDCQLHLTDYQRTGIPQAGVRADPAGAARNYLRIASTYGHPGAQYALGVMNIEGRGIKKNPVQALKWLTAAARKRHTEAEAYLGDLYWKGVVVKQSETRALMWYTLAQENAQPAEHGAILARYNELLLKVDGETRLEAEARARVWSDQYPAELAKN